jgi:hypothetical protein
MLDMFRDMGDVPNTARALCLLAKVLVFLAVLVQMCIC